MIRKSLAVAATLAATAGMTAVAPTTEARTLPATRVTAADLPRTADLVFPGVRFHADFRVAGEAQSPVSSCQTRTWSSLGANRTFAGGWSVIAGRSNVGTVDATVASFKTHAAAVKAANTMAASFTGCRTRFLKTQPKGAQAVSYLRKVTLPGGKPATLYALNSSSRWGTQLEEAGVTVTGTHAEIVAIHLSGVQAVFKTDEIRATMTRSVKTLA